MFKGRGKSPRAIQGRQAGWANLRPVTTAIAADATRRTMLASLAAQSLRAMKKPTKRLVPRGMGRSGLNFVKNSNGDFATDPVSLNVIPASRRAIKEGRKWFDRRTVQKLTNQGMRNPLTRQPWTAATLQKLQSGRPLGAANRQLYDLVRMLVTSYPRYTPYVYPDNVEYVDGNVGITNRFMAKLPSLARPLGFIVVPQYGGHRKEGVDVKGKFFAAGLHYSWFHVYAAVSGTAPQHRLEDDKHWEFVAGVSWESPQRWEMERERSDEPPQQLAAIQAAIRDGMHAYR